MPVHTFYTPMPSHCSAYQLNIFSQTADKITIFLFLYSIRLKGFLLHNNTFQTLPFFLLRHPDYIFCLIILPRFYLAVGFFLCLFITSFFLDFFQKPLLFKIFFYLFVHCPLISFQGKDIVSTFSPDLFCNPLLCSHCINCNYLIFYLYFFQQFRNCCYLIAFFLHCLLPKAKPIFLTPC